MALIPASDEPAAQFDIITGRVGPRWFQDGFWPCPTCGRLTAVTQEYQSGLSLIGGRWLRLHPPRRKLACVTPECGCVETIYDSRPAEGNENAQTIPQDAAAAWRQVRIHLNDLFEALADLDDAGGLAAAADVLDWKPRRWSKQLGLLSLLHQMLTDAIRRARDARRRG